MKLLKIGRNSACDITIVNPAVSGLHAELLILDRNDMRIEDKNSSNGTFVNNTRIKPNTPVTVKPGDVVRLGNEVLNWSLVMPYLNKIPDPKKYSEVKSIGTDNKNDIVITGDQTASRFHAYLLKKKADGKWYLRDNGSTNGTSVNGTKIQKDTDVRYSKKDTIICGSTDVSDQIKELIGPNPFPVWLKWTLSSVAAVAVIIGAYFLVKNFVLQDEWHPEKAVVYVDASYHYRLKFDTSKFPIDKDVWDAVIGPDSEYGVLELNATAPYSATAFFLDRNGYLATNRHVAIPWENEASNRYAKETLQGQWEVSGMMMPYVTPDNVDSLEHMNGLYARLIDLARNQTLKYGFNDYQTMNVILNKIKNQKPEVTGVLDYISVGYPGRNYTHQDEYDRCYVVATSDSPDKDVALLQLNKKKTPDDIPDVFSMDRAYTGTLKPVEMKMRWEGYPRGIGENLDKDTHSLEPQIRETTIGKNPSRYTFEIQGETGPGASGSPIFNPEKGEWYGIIWGGRGQTATYSLGCQAKYIKELYEKEVGSEEK